MYRQQAASPIGPWTRFGSWEVVEELGAGGMCETFAVRHAVAGGQAVAKVLRQELSYQPEIASRIEREARILAAIDHPNVVRLFDAGRFEDRPYLVMEVAGVVDLDRRMRQSGGAVPVKEAVRILASLLSALETVHARGFVHRDIKPSNVFLPETAGGMVKLIDFGVSLVTEEPALTKTGALFGTPAFMSPEQAGGNTVDHRSDLFALGSTIYAALTGRPPFVAENPVQVIMKLVREPAAPPEGLLEPVPPALSNLLLWMLATDPADRPQSAAEARAALDGLSLDPAPAKKRARGSVPLRRRQAPKAKAAAMAPPPPPAQAAPGGVDQEKELDAEALESARRSEVPDLALPRPRAAYEGAEDRTDDLPDPTMPAMPASAPSFGAGATPAAPRAKKGALDAVGGLFSRWFKKREEPLRSETTAAAPPAESLAREEQTFDDTAEDQEYDEAAVLPAEPLGEATDHVRTESSGAPEEEMEPDTAPRRPAEAPEPLEAQLERAGFVELGWRGQTPEGLTSYDASFEGERVVVHVGRRTPPHYQARARVAALRWLIERRPPLFVPFLREVPIGTEHAAFIRNGDTPKRLRDGTTLSAQAAVAVAVVAHRALSWLHAEGRRFDDFSLDRVRARTSKPESFACILDAPVEYAGADEDEAIYSTAAGGVIHGDPGFFSPGMVTGKTAQHDAAYRAGAILYSLLSGQPPFGHDHQALIGVFFRRVSEDPPPLSRYVSVDPALGTLVDRMVARDASFRARPPREIEEEMLALLDEDWRGAVEAVLQSAPEAEHVPDAPRKTIGASRGPTLADGDRISLWTVREHLHFGGEAELYRVTNESGARGILKLWYDDRVDPYDSAWREFKVGLTGCAAHPAFPALLDADVLVRGVARPYVVLEEIAAPTWRDKTQEGALFDPVAIFEIGAGLVEALAVVHQHFGVAGDVSGRNVLLAPGRGATLLDVASPGVTRSAVPGLGTAGYAAPEVANGEPPTKASDLFSAGLLLAELATGQPVFPRRVEETLIPVGGFEQGVAAALAAVEAGAGREAARALAHLLALDPRARPRTAAEAKRILEEGRARFEVRRAAERRTSSATLTGLERRMPQPIAHCLRAYRIAREPAERALLGFTLAETIARFLAVIAVSDYLSTGERTDRMEAELALFNRRLSFGMWIAVAREATRAVSGRAEAAFIPELVELFHGPDTDVRAALDRIIELRNGVLHRGTKPEAIVSDVDQDLRTVLHGLSFLSGRPLLRAIGQRTRRDGSLELEVEDLHGSALEPERRSLRVRKPPPTELVFLSDQDFSSRLLLDPLCVVRRCECGAAHFFIAASAKKDGRVEYVDASSGHRLIAAPEGADGESTFEEILADREALCLTGRLECDLSEAARWWAGDAPVGHGDVLGRYVLEEEIGRGSMGIVFRARHPELGAHRAVKVLKPELVESDRSLMRRLHQEARMMEQLSTHGGIARVFDYGTTTDEATCYLVMELLEGGNLADRLQRSPPPGLDEVEATWTALADALSFVHDHGIVHRDLKPSNVLFDREGRVKIADFGVARQLDAGRTATIGFEGAPLYAAPEQMARQAIDQRTDAYALGLVVFDLLLGRTPTLDGQRRAHQIRQALDAITAGGCPEALAHHEDRTRLGALLARSAALTALEPSERPANLGPMSAP